MKKPKFIQFHYQPEAPRGWPRIMALDDQGRLWLRDYQNPDNEGCEWAIWKLDNTDFEDQVESAKK